PPRHRPLRGLGYLLRRPPRMVRAPEPGIPAGTSLATATGPSRPAGRPAHAHPLADPGQRPDGRCCSCVLRRRRGAAVPPFLRSDPPARGPDPPRARAPVPIGFVAPVPLSVRVARRAGRRILVRSTGVASGFDREAAEPVRLRSPRRWLTRS